MSSLPPKLAVGLELTGPFPGWYPLPPAITELKMPRFLSPLPAVSKYNLLMCQKKNRSCDCQDWDRAVTRKLNVLHGLWCEFNPLGRIALFRCMGSCNTPTKTLLWHALLVSKWRIFARPSAFHFSCSSEVSPCFFLSLRGYHLAEAPPPAARTDKSAFF